MRIIRVIIIAIVVSLIVFIFNVLYKNESIKRIVERHTQNISAESSESIILYDDSNTPYMLKKNADNCTYTLYERNYAIDNGDTTVIFIPRCQ